MSTIYCRKLQIKNTNVQTKPYKNVPIILSSSSSSKFSAFVLEFNLQLKKTAEKRATLSARLEKPGWQRLRVLTAKPALRPPPLLKGCELEAYFGHWHANEHTKCPNFLV